MGKSSQPHVDPVKPAAAAARVRAVLDQAETPLTGAQIATRAGLSVQVVRHHLRAMQDAGTAYVAPTRGPGAVGRGRPARSWSLRREADSNALALVARVLATLVDDQQSSHIEGELARLGASLARETSANRDPLMTGLSRLGFSPRAIGDIDGRACIELDACPFFDPEHGVTDTRICRVHHLLAAGMTDKRQRIDELEINPRGVGCRLYVTDETRCG